jgi:hypothetical protein
LRFIAIVLIVNSCLIGQVESTSLKTLAEEALRSGHASKTIRQEAAWILSRDKERGLAFAAKASKHKDWRVRLSALSIWTCLGPGVAFQKGVVEHKLHLDANWLVRRTTLDSLIGVEGNLPSMFLRAALKDTNWSVRLSCLQLMAASSSELDSELADQVESLTADADQEVCALAWRVLIEAASCDQIAADRLHALKWEQLDSASLKRKAMWSVLDASRQGFLPTMPLAKRGTEISIWRRAHSVILAEPGVLRVAETIDLIRDKSAENELGEALCRALVREVAPDQDWLMALFPVHVKDDFCRLMLSAILTKKPTLALKIGLLDSICGFEQVDKVLLDAAYGLRPASLSVLLETWFVEKAKLGSSRRQLRRILKFRHLLAPPIADSFLINSLRRGGFARRVIVAEQIWRRSNNELRQILISFMPRLEKDRKTYRSFVRILCETPKLLAEEIYRSVIIAEDFSRNDRLMALNALSRLNKPIDLSTLKALMKDGVPADLRDRAIRIMVKMGDVPTQTIVVEKLKTSSGREFDLLTLNHALGCDDEELVEHISNELRQGRFTSTTLVPMLSFIKEKRGIKSLGGELRILFRSVKKLSEDKRRHTGFERIDGAVLEYILGNLAEELPLDDAFQLLSSAAVENKDRLLIGLVDYAIRTNRSPSLVKKMTALWDGLAEGMKDLKQRAFLARPLVLTGDEAGRRMVMVWLRRYVDELLTENSNREDGWYGVIAVDEILGSLIQEGSAAALTEVFALLAEIETKKSVVLLEQAGSAWTEPELEKTDTTLFLVGTLSSIGRSEKSISALHAAWRAIDRESQDRPALPLRFWLGWARLSVRFPEHNQPSEFIANGLLQLRAGNLTDSQLLMNLGRRALGTRLFGPGAELYQIGHARYRATSRSKTSDSKRSEVWRFRSPDANAMFWADLRAKFSIDQSIPKDEFTWTHRHHDEELAKFVIEMHGGDKRSAAWSTLALVASRALSNGLWETTRIRMLLNEKRFVEAETAAKNGADRVFAFGSSSRLGNRRSFLSYQAAALWGQGKKKLAKKLLRSASIHRLAHLEGPTVWDFPGF